VFFEPGHLADHLFPDFAQSPDQLSSLRGIPFPHREIVAPAGAPGTLNRRGLVRQRAAARACGSSFIHRF